MDKYWINILEENLLLQRISCDSTWNLKWWGHKKTWTFLIVWSVFSIVSMSPLSSSSVGDKETTWRTSGPPGTVPRNVSHSSCPRIYLAGRNVFVDKQPLTCFRTTHSPLVEHSHKGLFPSLVFLLSWRRIPEHCPEPWILLVCFSCWKEQSFNSPIIRLLTSGSPFQYV